MGLFGPSEEDIRTQERLKAANAAAAAAAKNKAEAEEAAMRQKRVEQEKAELVRKQAEADRENTMMQMEMQRQNFEALRAADEASRAAAEQARAAQIKENDAQRARDELMHKANADLKAQQAAAEATAKMQKELTSQQASMFDREREEKEKHLREIDAKEKDHRKEQDDIRADHLKQMNNLRTKQEESEQKIRKQQDDIRAKFEADTEDREKLTKEEQDKARKIFEASMKEKDAALSTVQRENTARIDAMQGKFEEKMAASAAELKDLNEKRVEAERKHQEDIKEMAAKAAEQADKHHKEMLQLKDADGERLMIEMKNTYAEKMKGIGALAHVMTTGKKNKELTILRELLEQVRIECKDIGKANNTFNIQLARVSTPMSELENYVMAISERKDLLQDRVTSFKHEIDRSGSAANNKEDFENKLRSVVTCVDAFGDAVVAVQEAIFSGTRPSPTTTAHFKATFASLREAVNALPSFEIDSIDDSIQAGMKALSVGIVDTPAITGAPQPAAALKDA